MTGGGQACHASLLWRPAFRHHPHEAAEYRPYRPCADTLRPAFVGRQAMSVSGRLLTAPDARCDHWASRGEETP
ncbi:hypothetical protein [Deinococcus sp. NW-56]|uniref:hypothetical protein n=1 Tax=Deinococcus sp. NW-56 TaxID=2080419 RepID=UPI000CF4EB14|nr:hypothetical protein [Deinococcus sp. NW-56]